MTGMDLRLKRVAADVKARQVADEIGVSAALVSRWEMSRNVSDEAAERYLAALAKIATNTTQADAGTASAA